MSQGKTGPADRRAQAPHTQQSLGAVQAGEDRLGPLSPPQTEGLLDWLLACPEKGSLVPIKSESTATLCSPIQELELEIRHRAGYAAHPVAPGEFDVMPPPFRIHAFVNGLQPGLDPGKMNQLLDELDAEEFNACREKYEEGSI